MMDKGRYKIVSMWNTHKPQMRSETNLGEHFFDLGTYFPLSLVCQQKKTNYGKKIIKTKLEGFMKKCFGKIIDFVFFMATHTYIIN